MLEKLKEIMLSLNEGVEAELITEATITRITTLFESAVAEKVAAQVVVEKAELDESNKAELQAFKDTLVETINRYSQYVAEEYMNDNQVAIEEGTKATLAMKLVEGVAGVFSEKGVDFKNLDEGAKTEIETLTAKVAEMESTTNESVTARVEAEKALVSERAQQAFAAATTGLDQPLIDRIATLSEDFDCDDTDAFATKVATLVEELTKKVDESSTPGLAKDVDDSAPEADKEEEAKKKIAALQKEADEADDKDEDEDDKDKKADAKMDESDKKDNGLGKLDEAGDDGLNTDKPEEFKEDLKEKDNSGVKDETASRWASYL